MGSSSLESIFTSIAGSSPIWQGLAGGIVIAFLNLVGALVVLVWREPSEWFLNVALGFAAGAMLFVISDEIVPETHRTGQERGATLGFCCSACL